MICSKSWIDAEIKKITFWGMDAQTTSSGVVDQQYPNLIP